MHHQITQNVDLDVRKPLDIQTGDASAVRPKLAEELLIAAEARRDVQREAVLAGRKARFEPISFTPARVLIMNRSVTDDAAPPHGRRLPGRISHYLCHRLALAAPLVVGNRRQKGAHVAVVRFRPQLRHVPDGSDGQGLGRAVRHRTVVAHGLASALLLAVAGAQVAAQKPPISCPHQFDGVCNEAPGSGCRAGTDGWDCRREGPGPGPESCRYSGDGECDEPGGTGYCLPGTDTVDCRAEGIAPLDVFFGADDRTFPSPSEYPWSAIGRVESNDGYCTGTLVAPQVVLTAAHCLYLGTDGRTLVVPTRFRAGVEGAASVGGSQVVDYRVPAQFDIDLYERGPEVDGYDWALLFLAEPVGETAGWVAVERTRRKELEQLRGAHEPIVQAGYSYDAAHLLSAHLGCALDAVHDDNTISHQCDSLQGDSGSPLLIAREGGYRLVALDSAAYDGEGNYPRNVAVDARAFWKAVARLRAAMN